MDNAELKVKAITENHDAQYKVALVNMPNGNDLTDLQLAAAKLVAQGFRVEKISCGECDEDDLLVQVHTCNPHKFTHNCTSRIVDKKPKKE